ncbi:MAG: hypothetical protein ACYDAO_06615 [Thermoplasmataceae archaeon]
MVKAKDTKEPIFVEPVFNEKEFLIDEKNRAKSTLMVFGIAAVLGLISGFLEIDGYWYLATVIFIFALLFFFKFLQILKIHIPKRMGQKFFLFATFLLTWIVFWIIAINPPLNVISTPTTSLELNSSTGWSPMSTANGNYVITITPHGNYSIRAYFSYIYNVTGANVTISINQPGSPTKLSYKFNNEYLYFNLSKTSSFGTTDYLYFSMISNGKTFTSTQEVFFNN